MFAVTVTLATPAVFGVPEMTPVEPFSVAQPGNPIAENVGAGWPLALTVKLNERLMVPEAALAEVKTGAWLTVSV